MQVLNLNISQDSSHSKTVIDAELILSKYDLQGLREIMENDRSDDDYSMYLIESLMRNLSETSKIKILRKTEKEIFNSI